MSGLVKAEVAIFGGGIAGLWTLTRLRQAGFAAVLFETEALGSGQTVKSQGIIHGGMKYALQGVLTSEATAMAAMPALWRSCLSGSGEINLKQVPVLSQAQYLWSPSKLGSKIAGFLAGAALSSKVNQVDKANYPYVFKNPAFKGALVALDEIVLDVPFLVAALAELNRGAIFKIKPFGANALTFDEAGAFVLAKLELGQASVTLEAARVVFAAGAGNDVVLSKWNPPAVAMQRRPLHMVMVKTPFYYPLFAHCMGIGPRPRLTVTTHRLANGEAVWYLGGLLAEEGVDRTEAAQIKAAKHELESVFPWLDFTGALYATVRVDRAEPHQKSGLKPESAFVKTVNNVTIAWPTKLALAPALAQSILTEVQAAGISLPEPDLSALRDWPAPVVAASPWESCQWKKDS